MNKFITLALFALCATMASGQVIGYPGLYSTLLNQQSSGSSSSAAASAAASSAANNNNQALIQTANPTLVSPLGPYLASPYAPIAGPYAPVAPISPFVPQGYVSPLVSPYASQILPIGAVGPCGTGGLVF